MNGEERYHVPVRSMWGEGICCCCQEENAGIPDPLLHVLKAHASPHLSPLTSLSLPSHHPVPWSYNWVHWSWEHGLECSSFRWAPRRRPEKDAPPAPTLSALTPQKAEMHILKLAKAQHKMRVSAQWISGGRDKDKTFGLGGLLEMVFGGRRTWAGLQKWSELRKSKRTANGTWGGASGRSTETEGSEHRCGEELWGVTQRRQQSEQVCEWGGVTFCLVLPHFNFGSSANNNFVLKEPEENLAIGPKPQNIFKYIDFRDYS